MLVILAQVTYHRGLTLAQESPVHEIFNMLLAVFDRAALMLFCLFFLIRIRLFRELLHKSAHSPKSCSPLPRFSQCLPCSVPGPAYRLKAHWLTCVLSRSCQGDSVWSVGRYHYGPHRGYSPLSDRHRRRHRPALFYHQYSGRLYCRVDQP